MKSQPYTRRWATALAAAIAAAWLVPVSGQQALPRTPDGKPDLQGTYDIAWITPFERPAQFSGPTMTADQAARLEQQVENRIEQAARPSDGNRAAPPIGGDGSTGAAGNVGGYNNFWIDSGTQYFKVNGQIRSSIVVDPANGRVPPTTAGARQRQGARAALPTSDQSESSDPGLGNPAAYDNPEQRPLAERCLLGFGSTSGPPALPVLYNNLHQIVQTKDHVMILNEMNHDARVVRMNSKHLPSNVRRWLGDSIGWWEGDTLVVETTNFTEKTRYRGSSPDLKVTERFSRLDGKTLLYRFTIDDPATWTSAWSGEYTWPETDSLLYEYACHEANYALENILKGARQRDRERASRSGGAN